MTATTPAPRAAPATAPPAAAARRRGTARGFWIEHRLDAEMVQCGPRDLRERSLDGLRVNAGVPRGGRSGGVDPAGRGRHDVRAHRAGRRATGARRGGLPVLGTREGLRRVRGGGVRALRVAVAGLHGHRLALAVPPTGEAAGAADPTTKNGGVAGRLLVPHLAGGHDGPRHPPSGHIFERRSIQHWLNRGTSPAPSPTSRCRRPCRSSPTMRSAAL
jgi:hypothetical protein